MSTVDQGSLAVLALTNRLVDAGVPALKASELWRLLDRVADPSSLLGLDEQAAAAATSGTGIEAARLVRLLDIGVGLAVRLDALEERGITAVTVLDERYPVRLRERLGTAAPPVLYCAGGLSLLGVDGIGVVGARDVGPPGVEVARKVAQHVAGAGYPLVSGGPRGSTRSPWRQPSRAAGGWWASWPTPSSGPSGERTTGGPCSTGGPACAPPTSPTRASPPARPWGGTRSSTA